jgi:protein TonB
MFDDRQKLRFHARSPVQPGQSPAPYFLLALVAAVLIWSVQQYGVPNVGPYLRHMAGKAQPATRAAQPPKGDVRGVFSTDDYPADALARGEQGTVLAQLTVDADGRVSGCAIVRSSGSRSLDDATCSIVERRARFDPARDAEGRAVASTYVTPPVVWRLAP